MCAFAWRLAGKLTVYARTVPGLLDRSGWKYTSEDSSVPVQTQVRMALRQILIIETRKQQLLPRSSSRPQQQYNQSLSQEITSASKTKRAMKVSNSQAYLFLAEAGHPRKILPADWPS